jgi:hypothetical protein
MEQLFHLPLSEQAWNEYQSLQDIIQGLQITEGDKDCWKYIWGTSDYTSSMFYNLQYIGIDPPKPFLWIWDSRCTNKIKVFGWLLLMDRLNVRNILKRKKFKLERNDYTCVLCSRGIEETTFHLFFSCPFSQECWRSLNIVWNSQLNFFNMMDQARDNWHQGFFMETFLLACWHIWKQRNAFIFSRGLPSQQSWRAGFRQEAYLQAYRMKTAQKILFSSLINSFV